MTHRSLRPLALWLAWLVVLAQASPSLLAAPSEAQLGRRYRQAERELREGREQAGELELLAILAAAPYHFKSHLALGRLYQTRDPQAALQHLNEARKIRPGAYQVHFRLGVLLEQQGRLKEAAEAFRQAIRLNASHYAANGRLRGILRRLRAGQSVVERAAEQFWVTPNLATLTLFGRIVMGNSEPRQALWEFESLRDRLPGLPEVNLWVARAQRRLGSLEGELEAYHAFLAQNGEADGVRLTLLARLVEGWRFRRAAESVALLEKKIADNRLGAREAARFFYLDSKLEMARGKAGLAADRLLKAGELGHPPAEVSASFQSYVRFYPENARLWNAFGTWLSQHGRLESAAGAFLQAASRDPALRPAAREALVAMAQTPSLAATASLALGELALAEGDPGAAREFLERVPPSRREGRRASMLLGLIHQQRGEVAESLAALTRYVFSFEDRLGMTYARGNVMWQLGQQEAAVAFWRQGLERLREYPGALGQVADYHQRHQQTREEIAVRRLLSGAAPDNLANRARLGEIYFQGGRREEAIAEWEQVVARKTGDFQLLVRLGQAYLAGGKLQKGAEAFHRAAQIENLAPAAARTLARHLVQEGRHGDALLIVEDLYQANPADPEVARLLPGLVLNTPAPPDLRLTAAGFALAAERPETAIDILAQLLADRPAAEEARFMLARLYLKTDDPEGAEKTILAGQAVAELKEPEKLKLLADAQARLGKEQALTETLLRLRAVSAGDAARDRTLGLLLVRLGRPAEALPLLRNALAVAGEEPELLVPLAQAELAVRQPEAAIGHLTQALAAQPQAQPVRALLISTLLAARRWGALAPHLEVWVADHPGDAKARYNLITAYLRDFQAAKARPHYRVLRDTDATLAARLARYFPDAPAVNP